MMAGVPKAESVAAHSHGVALVALALGPRVDPPLDVDRAVALASVHDVPEALISDLPRPASELLPDGAKREAELAAARILLPPLSDLAHTRFQEYVSQETREARFTRLCDRLHMGVMLVAYYRTGTRGLDEFVRSVDSLDCAEFPPCAVLREELLEACQEFLS